MNLNNQIDWNDTDRIVSNDVRFVMLDGDWWRESSSWQTRQNDSPELTLMGRSRTRLTGLGNGLVSETRSFDPLGHTVTTTYDAEGRILAQRGATYPVDYTYDAYGNKVSMTTYREEPECGGRGATALPAGNTTVGRGALSAPIGDTTRWLYDEPSGCMTNKVYADGKGPSYSYTPDGKLARRTWARGIVTDYTYDNAGNLTRTEYDDNGVTPTITMSYDRVGNLVNATTAGIVTNLYAYDIYGQCTNEWQNDFNLTRYYDTLGRNTGYAIDGERQTTIAYDTYGRIATMTTATGGAGVPPAQGGSGLPTASNGGEFTWTYLPGSDLKASLQYPNGLTASWTYDGNNQLLQVTNATPTNVISQFDYTYDAAGRRTAIAKSGSAFGDLSGSIDSYTYNARSELISARRTKNGQPIPGFSEDFDYDPIGNRRSSATYNEKGEAQTSTYEANSLNQYTSRTTPGYAAVRGEADSNATVTVNENPTFRLGSYYFGSDLFDNTSAGGLANLETYATLLQTAANGNEADDLVSTETNQVYIAQSPETFAYDDDGNQTQVATKTGLWRVTYNGENRPVRWVRDSDNTTLVMSYDHMGRRREKNAQRFFYDGYLQVADNVGNSYAWDCTEPIATRPLSWRRDDFFGYYAHDGNKNMSEVVGLNVDIVAHYEYSLFGASLEFFRVGVGDDIEKINPWRFSSEYTDDDTGDVAYNSRFYDCFTGRFLSKDKVESKTCYGILDNSCINDFDYLGMMAGKYPFDSYSGVKYDLNGINCLGYAIGLNAAVDPWRNSLDYVLSQQGFVGTEVSEAECKCEKCDDVLVYVYVYINKARINQKDFSNYAEWHREQFPDIWGTTNYWCNLDYPSPIVDFHAIRKDCNEGDDMWVYVDRYYPDRSGRAWLPNVMERESYFPVKDQVISGKCFRKKKMKEGEDE